MSEPRPERLDAPDTATRCRTMDEVRQSIDRVDRAIVALLAERAGYVRQAGRIKTRREEIVDPARIEEVVAKVRAHAKERGLAPDLADSAYRLMIGRFIELEAEEFDRLRGRSGG